MSSSDKPRVLIISPRRFKPTICRTSQNEYEDTIVSMDAAELVAPGQRPTVLSASLMNLKNRLMRRSRIDVNRQPRPEPTVPSQAKYDLVFAILQHPSDVMLLDRGVPDWRERAAKAICYVEELWLPDLIYAKMLRGLSRFDAVVCNTDQSNAPLSKIIGVPCVWDGIGVDAMRFCPYPLNPRRAIDFLSVGRRGAKTHAALMEMSRARDFYYVYDTISAESVINPREHRELLAARVKRARYFLANKPKVDKTDHRGQQEEVGMRYYEGAAGGAVMVGEFPKSPRFTEHFGWEDSCIRLPYDSTDVAGFLEDLDRQPARMERVRRENVVNSLLRHDWAYRWKQVLKLAGLPTMPATEARIAQLRDLANRVHASGGLRVVSDGGERDGAPAATDPTPIRPALATHVRVSG